MATSHCGRENDPISINIPIRTRETRHLDVSATPVKHYGVDEIPVEKERRLSQTSRCPEGLTIVSTSFNKGFRDRSPTSSTMSSTNIPDSATTGSMPMSPTLSTFTRATTPDLDAPDRSLTPFQLSRSGQGGHRYRESCDSCSTFVDSLHEESRYAVNSEIAGPWDKDEDVAVEDISGPEDPPPMMGTPRPQTAEASSSPMENAQRVAGQGRLSFDSGIECLSRRWETTSPSTPEEFSNEDTDAILDYTLQIAYGVDLEEVAAPPAILRQLVSRFIQDIGRFAFNRSPMPIVQLVQTTSTSSGSSGGFLGRGSAPGSGRGSQNGKRKKGGDGDEEGDEISDDEGDSGAGMPFKRARASPREAEENLRLSCPFRKRNPHRFNVREHHSCAMTYFPKFAELRQHIVKQHKRNDPSAFVCDRCNRDFPSRKDLRDHQRLPKELMCDISDHDPESGIDGPTATKLLSRKRASGMSTDVQWKEIWNLLFPDDDDREIQAHDFCPVIEHFELQTQFLASLKALEGSLRNNGLNEQTLETIGNLYRNQFIQVIEQCTMNAQLMPYSNRSNRKNDTSPSRFPVPRHVVRNGPRPDSGVDVDDGSEDNQSVGVFTNSGYESSAGQSMLAHSDSVKTVRRVSSTSTEFRGSNQSRALEPLMEQTQAAPSPRFPMNVFNLQQQTHGTAGLPTPDPGQFMAMPDNMLPIDSTLPLWQYQGGDQQGQYWNPDPQENAGIYDFTAFMPR